MKEKENEIRIPNISDEKAMSFSEKKKAALESITSPGSGRKAYDLEQTLSSQQRKFLDDAKFAPQNVKSELSSDKELLAGAIAGDATSQAYIEMQERIEKAKKNEQKRSNAEFEKTMQKSIRKTRNAELER